jgi:hypothetical protein
MTEAPRWRQAYDAAERRVTPHADRLVRTPSFAVGAAVLRRAQHLARSTAQGVSARAWHLLNLPAGSDVSRLRAQIGALDREVRRLSVQWETERRRPVLPAAAAPSDRTVPDAEEPHAEPAESADGAGPGPARRRTQRPAGA